MCLPVMVDLMGPSVNFYWKYKVADLISWFLKMSYSYPDAAEEDVKRYEQSFRRLRPAHKVFYFFSFVTESYFQ